MGFKDSKVYGIVNSKCPRCHEGDMFFEKNPYNLAKTLKMRETCEVCDQKFIPEPSFYYGGMYVNYAYTTALFIAVFLFNKIIYPLTILQIVLVLAGLIVVLLPLILRLSRSTWLSIFVKYDPDWRNTSNND